MDIQAQLAQAALDEQRERQQRENAVAEAVGARRGRRVVDVIAIGSDADIAVVSERAIDNLTTRTVYQPVYRQRFASTRVHLSLDLALLHLVEIRAALCAADEGHGAAHAYKRLSDVLHGAAYAYAARVLNVTEEV
jgi:hypothetical protein